MKTGYEDWDQNLKTLSQSLFPDPSLAARGYYYGTEARKGQLESNKLIDQQNWRNRYGMMTQGGAQPGPLTFQQPGNVPGAAPIAAPPSNLPMAGAPAAAAPSLAAAVTTMTPGQAADMVPAAVAPYTQGTPPPASPPSAVSPPAPNTTTSNGQVPTNDPVSGLLNPGSTTDPNGGPKQAGPATSNGSVAPVPPGMTLPGLMAMHGAGALAGIDAATLAGGGQALAYELYSKGIIGLPQYKQMLAGTGQAGPLDADIAAEAAVKGHQLAAGATLGSARIQADASMANQRLVTGETRHEFEQKPLPYVDENGVTRYVPQVQAPGKQYFEPTVAAERQRQGGAYGQYITPEKPGGTTMRAADAAAQGVPAVPQSLDQQNAILDAAIQQASRAGNQDEVRRLTNVKLQLATLPKGPVAAKEADEQAQVNYRNDQAHYPQPDPTTAVDMYVKAPVMFKPEAERAITERMKQLRGTDRYLTLNATELRSEARQQLEDENVLYKPEEINALRREDIRAPGGRDPRIQRVQPVGAAAPSDHMMIGLKPKGGTTTGGTTTGGTTAAEPPISTVVAPRPDKNRQINRASVPGRPAGAARATTAAPATTAATPAGPPPGATGKLPAGTPDGPFRLQSGEVGTALGGYYIPPTR